MNVITQGLLDYVKARGEFGEEYYKERPVWGPLDSRNTTLDALEEAVDLSQYLMKRVLENQEIAALLEEAARWTEDSPGGKDATRRCLDMAARLRADCERSVAVTK